VAYVYTSFYVKLLIFVNADVCELVFYPFLLFSKIMAISGVGKWGRWDDQDRE
jgi:hypothetical protein